MSEKQAEKKEEGAKAEAGASKKPMLIVGAAALVGGLALGGFVLPKFVGGEHAAEVSAEHAGAKPEEASDGAEGGGAPAKAGDSGADFSARIVQLEPFVVNVSGENYPRYLKLQVVFEMSSPEAKGKLEERVAAVRDLTISLLSSKRLADITDFEGKALLKDDLRQQVDELLGKGSVEGVMFTEFVVQ